MSFQKKLGLAIAGGTLLAGATALLAGATAFALTDDMCAKSNDSRDVSYALWDRSPDLLFGTFHDDCTNLHNEDIGNVSLSCVDANGFSCQLIGTLTSPGTALTAFAFDSQGQEIPNSAIGVGRCTTPGSAGCSGLEFNAYPSKVTLYIHFYDEQ